MPILNIPRESRSEALTADWQRVSVTASTHSTLYTFLGGKDYLHEGREHGLAVWRATSKDVLADQGRHLYLVGHDLRHPAELD